MAINTTTRQTTAFTSGNNFAFAFKVYEEGDVKVIRITTSTGAEEVLTITTHYTVTLNDDQNANPGGTVTLVNSGNPVNLGSGFNVVITSKVTPLQQTEITNQGGFFPEVINDVLDKAAILDQQQQSILDKTIRFPLTQTIGGLEITENAANRAGKVVQFDGSGDLVILGTVDGRDVSADGTKLDGIESNATADQTAAEIRTLVESASDSNVFTDADHSKLNAIEAGATGDQNASEIRTLVESASDSNVFTDNDHTKLNNIEDNATRDQTAGEIKTLLQSDKLTASELANNSVTVSQIQDSEITAAKLNPATVITASEQASATTNDTSFLTSAAADARFFNISSGDTIKDGDTFPDNDTTIATTAAINDRIIDLVDDVGGFVPIANETSFPTANPDAENGTGTVVSVKAASTDLTPSGTTVTIANGAGTGNTVTITGVPSVIPAGYGFIVETTTTSGNGSANPPRQYTFHRLTPKATEVTTVAGKATEIGRLGTADAVADMAILGTTDVVADMNMLATTDIVADMALLATNDVIADMALLAVADVISDMNDLATSANITAMANCSNSITSINTASSNLNSINNFGDTYQVAANDPTTDGGGNSLSEGDLYFNTSANRLKVYDGSGWVNGVEISGAGAVTTGNTFTGDNRYNDNVKALFGTGSDLEIFHNGTDSHIKNNTGEFKISANNVKFRTKLGDETLADFNANGNVELYHNNAKRLETSATGGTITGPSTTTAEFKIFGGESQSAELQLVADEGDDYTDRLRLHQSQNSNFYIQNLVASGTWDTYLQAAPNGSLIQFYDNSEKLRTTSTGITVTGQVKADVNTSLNSDTEYNGQDFGFLVGYDGGADAGSEGNGICFAQQYASGDASIVRTGAIIGYKQQATGNFGGGLKLKTQKLGANPMRTALQLDQQQHVLLPNDDTRLKLGASADLQIYHDGSNSYVEDAGTGSLILKSNHLVTNAANYSLMNAANNETLIYGVENGAVQLYYDNSKKFETDNVGAKVSGHLYISHELNMTTGGNKNRFIDCSVDDGEALFIRTTNGGDANHQYMASFYRAGGVELYYATVKKFETTNAGISVFGNCVTSGTVTAGGVFNSTVSYGGTAISLGDNQQIHMGASNDFRIFHDSANSYITDVGTGNLYIQGSTLVEIRDPTNGESYAKFSHNGNVELYHDNSKKLETYANGIVVTGTVAASSINLNDNNIAYFGTGADLLIYHDGSENLILTNGPNLRIGTTGETFALLNNNGAVDLYHDNARKLSTKSTGIEIPGNCAIELDNGNWTGNHPGKIQHHNNYLYIQGGTNGFIFMSDSGTGQVAIDSGGNLIPNSNNLYDLGSTAKRWRNIYTNDLNLSNEGGANDVDGTWGSYTIQEGAEDLFLVNRRNGKKYKFNLTEVS